jgi:hypothetical protein
MWGGFEVEVKVEVKAEVKAEVELKVKASGTCTLGGNSELFLANCSIGKMNSTLKN